MKVAKNNYEKIMERIHEKRWHGYEFVVFSKTVPASMDSMIFCFTAEEAKEECRHDDDYLATRTAYRVMGNGLNDQSLLITADGLVDVDAMVTAYHNKLLKGRQSEKCDTKNRVSSSFKKRKIKW